MTREEIALALWPMLSIRNKEEFSRAKFYNDTIKHYVKPLCQQIAERNILLKILEESFNAKF